MCIRDRPGAQQAWPPAPAVDAPQGQPGVDRHRHQGQGGEPAHLQHGQDHRQEPEAVHVQRKHQMLRVVKAAVPVDELERQRKAGQQQEHRTAEVGQEAVLEGIDLAGHLPGVDVDAALHALADPAGQALAIEHAIAQTRLALAQGDGEVLVLVGHLGGLSGVDLHRTAAQHTHQQQHHEADAQVQAQRQHVVLAAARQVACRQLAGLEQQQPQRAPQRAFGGEVGAAELLQEFPQPGCAHMGLLPAGTTEPRPRFAQGRAAVQAMGRPSRAGGAFGHGATTVAQKPRQPLAGESGHGQ